MIHRSAPTKTAIPFFSYHATLADSCSWSWWRFLLETTLNTPMDALVADMVKLLDDNEREDFEERAAIIEFDANLPRGHAECLALLDVLRRNPAVLTKIS